MKQRELMIILIPLFILTVLWVVFNIYHNYVTSTIKDPLSFQIVPIDGTFDTQAIEEIKKRQKINPLFEAQVEEIPTSPTPTPEETGSASTSSELTPIVTEGANP